MLIKVCKAKDHFSTIEELVQTLLTEIPLNRLETVDGLQMLLSKLNNLHQKSPEKSQDEGLIQTSLSNFMHLLQDSFPGFSDTCQFLVIIKISKSYPAFLILTSRMRALNDSKLQKLRVKKLWNITCRIICRQS